MYKLPTLFFWSVSIDDKKKSLKTLKVSCWFHIHQQRKGTLITTQPWSSHKHGLSKHTRIKRRMKKESFAWLSKSYSNTTFLKQQWLKMAIRLVNFQKCNLLVDLCTFSERNFSSWWLSVWSSTCWKTGFTDLKSCDVCGLSRIRILSIKQITEISHKILSNKAYFDYRYVFLSMACRLETNLLQVDWK